MSVTTGIMLHVPSYQTPLPNMKLKICIGCATPVNSHNNTCNSDKQNCCIVCQMIFYCFSVLPFSLNVLLAKTL